MVPHWWHVDAVGHFVNSLHFWSVQVFFFFMVLHLWAKFFMGAYRDGRGKNWMLGVVAFIVSIIAAFTGYLSQTNFDSQWIGVSAKDAMNSIGVGGFFNVLNFGQMYSFHVILLPAALVALIAHPRDPRPRDGRGAPLSRQRRDASALHTTA